MAIITLTESDILGGKIIPQGWYVFEIMNVVDEKSKSDPTSTNTVATMQGREGEATGVEVKSWFPEKYPRMAGRFLRAINGGDLVPNQAYDPKAGVGMKIAVFITTDTYKNQPTNRASDFRPLSEHVA